MNRRINQHLQNQAHSCCLRRRRRGTDAYSRPINSSSTHLKQAYTKPSQIPQNFVCKIVVGCRGSRGNRPLMQDYPQLMPISITLIIHELYLAIPVLKCTRGHRAPTLLVTEMRKMGGRPKKRQVMTGVTVSGGGAEQRLSVWYIRRCIRSLARLSVFHRVSRLNDINMVLIRAGRIYYALDMS